ncbi:enoyl-CoA hydratase/isomerase family protein [Aspergillus ibericus CBS 121593]|uniref:ClpP/crotonase n=1 Tax=Aspergillus ibericus CBS 121593 TaxID=1448316 RepID=A0A395GVE4_9EURO|nr:ClpP/crotonase [Aspergillus ibericus CBS 121593]RAK99124.1 ClpP/crotonase [Aspergillus ibericus CBS 121593]
MSLPNHPSSSKTLTLSQPHPSILLVTISRPTALNSISSAGHQELHAIWTWMDEQPSIRVGILTGAGRAFCAGADLKEWNNTVQGTSTSQKETPNMPPSGFGGLSRRSGKKPIICAVNGLCLGGGCEMVLNADLVIAAEKAYFGLPEVQRGVVAWAGALPRLVRTVGRQRAMEMALTGRRVGAAEALQWGFVNEVVPAEGDVVKRAVEVAAQIAANSPDAVIVSREGVKLGWEGLGAEEASSRLIEEWSGRLNAGDNIQEGLRAFVEKRKPRWVDSKL